MFQARQGLRAGLVGARHVHRLAAPPSGRLAAVKPAVCEPRTLIARSRLGTEALARLLARDIRAADCYCLHGDVGAGKSVFRWALVVTAACSAPACCSASSNNNGIVLHLCKHASGMGALGSQSGWSRRWEWYPRDFNSQQNLQWPDAPPTLLQHHQQAPVCWDAISGLALYLPLLPAAVELWKRP